MNEVRGARRCCRTAPGTDKMDNRNNIYIRKKVNMIRRITRVLTVLVMAAAMLGMQPLDVNAEGETKESNPARVEGVVGGAYEVTSYDMRADVGKDHTCEVTEEIKVNIPDTLTQIEFAIPSGSFRMRGLDVEGVAFNVKNTTAGSQVIIVDQDALTTGEHTYVIKYKIYEFADRNSDKDIFYFNVLQPDWKQPIAEMHAMATFPGDFPIKEIKHYAGQFGAEDKENRLTYKPEKASCSYSVTGQRIPENYGITLKAELPDGYWQGALDGVWAIFAMIFAMGAAVLVMMILWIIGGRDPRIRRVPQRKPIEGLTPVELGYVFNNRLDGRDLVRMIIYFAVKGYLKISEYEPKRYKLIRRSDPDGEEKLLRNAYGILFEDVYKGRDLDMDDIGDRLMRIEREIRDDVAAGFSARDMQAYTPLSKAFRIVCIVLTGISVAVTNGLKYSYQYVSVNYIESVLIGLAVSGLVWLLCLAVDRRDSSSGEIGRTVEILIGAVLACVIMYFAISIVTSTGHVLAGLLITGLCAAEAFMAVIMRARGKGNSVLMMRLRQLRRFIAHPTPKEVLENYLADPGYYYDMMIYALTFGAEESWAISFLTLNVPKPDWYSDDIEGQAFSNLREEPTTVDYARDVRSFVRTIEGAYDEMMRHRHRG